MTHFPLAFLCYFLFVILIIVIVCDIDDAREFRKQAIDRHAAHYDPQTGKFTWNDEAAK